MIIRQQKQSRWNITIFRSLNCTLSRLAFANDRMLWQYHMLSVPLTQGIDHRIIIMALLHNKSPSADLQSAHIGSIKMDIS